MTISSTDSIDDLHAAASLLHSLGHADPDRVGAAVRLHCLAAADHLRAAGAQPKRIEVDLAEVAIRSAMAHLGRLPRSMFANDQVVAAADAVQIGLERAQDIAAEP